MNKKELFRLGLGITISIAALAVVFYFIDPTQAFQALKEVDYRYLIPLIALSVCSIGVRAMAWQTILPKRLPFKKVFLTINAGYFLNTILPFRMGEIGRAFLLKSSGLDFWQVLPTILVERAFDILIAVGLFMGALPFVLQLPQGSLLVIIIGVLVLTALAVLYFMVRYQVPLLRWVETRSTPWPNIQERVHNNLREILSGLGVLADIPRFARAFAWMTLSWALALCFQYLLLRVFLPQAEILWAVFALGAVALGVAMPSSPGSLGVYEASLVAALLTFNIPNSVALAYAILSHLTNLIVVLPIGAYALFREGIAFKSLFDYRRKTSN
ncbi:MAG: hypothetical protein DRI56_03655 [Chloroflexota bacterium]|nr:MAG: hypothetical protein B6243_00400 [Anaerolineaceae bacterium 4572_5.2]RLD09770.1 MAG: hypothetical protein DRI56_03655 [Chloroflexota bacterium]